MLSFPTTTALPPANAAGLAVIRQLALILPLLISTLRAGETTRVSVDSKGTEGIGGFADQTACAGHGRYVAFDSDHSNLVKGDTNDRFDVFFHDRKTGATARVSVRSDGGQALTGDSFAPTISANGRYIAFESAANDLVEGDDNQHADVFLHDRKQGTTRRISVSSAGAQGTGESDSPAISANGRYIAFESDAKELVPGDTNQHSDVFVHDRKTGKTTRVSVDADGVQANGSSFDPAISGDGRFVAFVSTATNLVPGDTNGRIDVFVRDRETGAIERATIDSSSAEAAGGDSGTPSISADGRFVAFASRATNLVTGDSNAESDTFLRDRQKATTVRISVDSNGAQANGPSFDPAISANGRYIAFETAASNLFPDDANGAGDIAIHDRKKHTTATVSVSEAGALANGGCYYPSISGDGKVVAFASEASNLVVDDTNANTDSFVRERD